MTDHPIDYKWLIDACGDDQDRCVELLLLLSAAGSLTQAFEVTDLHRARLKGYRDAMLSLVEKVAPKKGGAH